MGEIKLRPTLQYSVLCESVSPPDKNGVNKPVFSGIFASIVKPGALAQFFIANRWINGQGLFKEQIKILNPDLTDFISTEASEFKLADKIGAHDSYNGFVNLNFPVPGVYWVKVELDGKTAISYPLPVYGSLE